MKTMEQIETIRRLYADGDGYSRIAKEMHIDRKTVKKYVAMDDFNETVEDKIPRIVGSKLDPYKATINKLLEEEKASGVYHKQRFTAKRMHEYLVRECGASELENSYQLVQRYMNEQKRIAKRGLAKAGEVLQRQVLLLLCGRLVKLRVTLARLISSLKGNS